MTQTIHPLHCRATLIIVAFLCLSAFAFAQPKHDPLAAWWIVTGKDYPAGQQFVSPGEWKPGQYIVTGITVNGRRDSISRMTIVRKDAEGWVIEFDTVNMKGQETTSQILLCGYDEAEKSGDFSVISVGWIKRQDENGKIKKLEGNQIGMFNALMKQMFEKMLSDVPASSPGGPVAVPAGTFADTTYGKSSVKVLGFNVETETWYNEAVPINGVVKTRTTDGKTVTELLSFGTDGKPSIN
jgi:hypothetical protein